MRISVAWYLIRDIGKYRHRDHRGSHRKADLVSHILYSIICIKISIIVIKLRETKSVQ